MHHRIYDPEYQTRRDQPFHNVRAFAHTIKALMGIRGDLPRSGTSPVYVQGVKMWVRPLPEAPDGRRRNFQGLRVMCECPMCGAVLAVGRLNQHRCSPKPIFDLIWAPEGRRIVEGVIAKDARAAIRQAPKPYRKFLGEIRAEPAGWLYSSHPIPR